MFSISIVYGFFFKSNIKMIVNIRKFTYSISTILYRKLITLKKCLKEMLA